MKLSPRRIVQSGFLLLVAILGVQFYRFVEQFSNPGSSEPVVAHPSGVEAFLPIGGLTSLKYFLSTGEIHPLHPASFFIFIAALGVSAVLSKSFCSWICPVGFFSELLYQPWKRRFSKNLQLPRWMDWGLRSIKYLVLLFFVWAIGVAMSPEQTLDFLNSDYWKVADVKMLYFFTRMSGTALLVITTIVLLSIPVRMFWCRFLCPYGALLGIVGRLSPFRIRRDPDRCNGCQKCTRNCPSHLPVSKSKAVKSVECSSCLTCQVGCPRGALSYSTPSVIQKHALGLNARNSALTTLGVFFAIILIAKLTGNWRSQVSPHDLSRLIPQLDNLGHPR